MIRNYITSVWRYVAKNKAFTIINISGLAIGMMACILISQFVMHEFGYDKFWKDSDRIFRVQLDRYNKGEITTRWASGCLGIGPDLKANFPEVSAFVRMTKSNAVLSNGDTFFKEDAVYYTSQDFFKVFSRPLLQGSDSDALKGPNKMVISQSLAKKYFGSEEVLGKHLKNNKRIDYEITGIFEDLPENSHLKIDAMLSFATYAVLRNTTETDLNAWYWDGFFTYIRLNPNADAKTLEGKLPAYVEKKEGEALKQDNAGMIFNLMPISDIHLDSDFIGEFKANGNRDATYFLLIVAVLILIIAWINYINLSTAKSIERAREVGVRKVMGSFRWQLVQQFLFESLVLNALAVMLAIALVVLVTPSFGKLTGRELNYALFQNPMFWTSMVLLIVGGAALSGVYPAFVLSAYKPVEVLKGRFKNSKNGILFRKGMVVIQFIASITLIVGTFTVYNQISFMRNQKLGVDIEQTVILRVPNIIDSTYKHKYEILKHEVLQFPDVMAICASNGVPGTQPDWNAGGIRRLSQREDEANQYRILNMDGGYIKLYGLEVLNGRGFDDAISNERKNVLLNESAVRLMGFGKPEDAIDDKIYFWGDTFRIIGVLKNYHHESMKKSFDPLIFRYDATPSGFYSIKFKTSNTSGLLSRLEEDWKGLFPGNPFNFFFLDEHYNQQYKADQQFGKVFGIFSVLAIFIACLGLYGLSALTALQRTKEIGVRKVMGASVTGILTLISKEYLILMGIAMLLAVPLAGWAMNNWLQDFASHITLSWWIFALPGLLVILIAFVTISIHILKAARTNPVKSLRYE